MKIYNPSVELWEQPEGKDGMFQHIERVARICYASENKSGITSRQFVASLMNKDHARPLEFGSVYLCIPDTEENAMAIHLFLDDEKSWSKTIFNDNEDMWYVTTNFRVICKHPDVLMRVFDEYWVEPTERHKKRVCMHFVTSRGVGDEYRTHIALSSVMQSTRYCNYSQDKFGNEVSYVIPEWYRQLPDGDEQRLEYCCKLTENEKAYFDMLVSGRTPQEARDLLGLGVRTELVLSGYHEGWDNFFYRRLDKAAHPDARYLAQKAFELYK